MAEELREVGIIKFYNPRKGYGFVTRADGSDVFFHLTHFRTPTNPALGNVVQFAVGQNREGLTAADIELVAPDEIDRYGGTIVRLDDEGGLAMTPDDFEVRFRRADYIPHSRADSLRLGDEVEMHFLLDEADGWRAAVVRSPDYEPEPMVIRGERRAGDDEEENRRLLGILYKTDLDEEARHAGSVLAERNMRATLSALVSRVFDRRLSLDTRRVLLALCTDIYLDDDCREYLDALTETLRGAVEAEDDERNPAAVAALRLLLDEERFPVRWSQYLLPCGLSLLRNLSGLAACHAALAQHELEQAAERWLWRVCRHVEQRRSGFGYVLTTALGTFDELWQRGVLHVPIRRVLARLLPALDAELLAGQVHHLRDKLSPAFLLELLPSLTQHPEFGRVLDHPGHAEVIAGWLESVLTAPSGAVHPAVLATLLPVIEAIRARSADDQALSRIVQPLTEGLSTDEILRMLAEEDLPERSGWACLRHLELRGELHDLLADHEARALITRWLRRTAERPSPAPAQEQELNTALRLIETLRGSEELHDELEDIGQSLFSGLHERVAQASGAELVALLEQLPAGELPGIGAVLARRLIDPRLDEAVRRRVAAHLGESGPPLAELAAALAAWHRDPSDRGALMLLVDAITISQAAGGEAHTVAEVARAELRDHDITWLDGFVTVIEPGPGGSRRARVQGFNILLPERLFGDRADFAVNRYVRLLLRRGMALGVVRAAVPETGCVCGRLDGPLFIDERDAVVGVLVDLHGARCCFEVAEMKSGQDRALADGDLLRFTRMASAGGAGCDYAAFNVHADFGPGDLPLLLEALVLASDEGVAAAACRVGLGVEAPAAVGAWSGAWQRCDEARRTQLLAGLDESERRRLQALVGGA